MHYHNIIAAGEKSACARFCPLNSRPRESWDREPRAEMATTSSLPPITAFTALTDIAEDEQVRGRELRGISAACVRFKAARLSRRQGGLSLAACTFAYMLFLGLRLML